MDQLEKIRRHHWKERLNISNNDKFGSDTSQAIEDIASQSCENLRRLYGGVRGGGGGKFVSSTIQTFIKFRDFEGLYFR